jgi:small basic protein
VLALFGLVVGALVAVLLRPTVPQDMSRYVAMAVVAAIDSALGGVRSSLERTFNDRIFVIAFVLNAALAVFLVWIGDQLATGDALATAVVVVFGVRIFQNLAAIRRRVFGG